jgi:hypothetical protein
MVPWLGLLAWTPMVSLETACTACTASASVGLDVYGYVSTASPS